jgi:hypothetical protein
MHPRNPAKLSARNILKSFHSSALKNLSTKKDGWLIWPTACVEFVGFGLGVLEHVMDKIRIIYEGLPKN